MSCSVSFLLPTESLSFDLTFDNTSECNYLGVSIGLIEVSNAYTCPLEEHHCRDYENQMIGWCKKPLPGRRCSNSGMLTPETTPSWYCHGSCTNPPYQANCLQLCYDTPNCDSYSWNKQASECQICNAVNVDEQHPNVVEDQGFTFYNM